MLEATADEAVQIAVFDHPSAARTAQFLESLPLSRRLDGIVVMSVPLEAPAVQSLRTGRLPAVLVDTVAPGLTSVVTDDVEGGAVVAAALVEQGHRRIAYLGEAQSAPDFESPSRLRLRGLRAGLAAAGLDLPERDVVLVGPGTPTLRQAVRDLLERPDRPTAVFAHCDLFAAAVLGVAAEAGLRVPQDLAVVGYDDSEWAEAIGLTTVRQPLRESGRVATQALLRLLADGTTTPMRISLPVVLVRRSTL
jgi:LacI family transcriptional regulator